MNQTHHFPANLRDVAVRGRSTFSEHRHVLQDLSFVSQGYDINQLARQLRGAEELDHALVLPTFFSPGAVALLMGLPNLFWFWNVVYYAVGESGGSALIDESAVQRVINGRFRERRAAFYDLKKPIDQLSPRELAMLVAEGVVLFKTTEWQHLNGAELVLNPMFLPQAEG